MGRKGREKLSLPEWVRGTGAGTHAGVCARSHPRALSAPPPGGVGDRELAAASAAAAAAFQLPAPVPGWPGASRPDAARSLALYNSTRARPGLCKGWRRPAANGAAAGAEGPGMGGARVANRGPGSPGSRVGGGAPPLADLEPGLRWPPPAAQPAGRNASGAGVGGGEGGCPPAPHRCVA